MFVLNSDTYWSLLTKKVGNIDPKAFPTLFAMLAHVVAKALEASENHVRASNELEFKKKGCPKPANVLPNMKRYLLLFTKTLIHIPMPVKMIPAKIPTQSPYFWMIKFAPNPKKT